MGSRLHVSWGAIARRVGDLLMFESLPLELQFEPVGTLWGRNLMIENIDEVIPEA